MTPEEQQKQVFFDRINGLLNSNIITPEKRADLDGVLSEVEALIKTPRPDNDSEAEALYLRYKELIGSYGKRVGETTYALPLTVDELKFIKASMRKRVPFVRDEIFHIQQVWENFVLANDKKSAEELTAVRVSIEMATWITFVLGKLQIVGTEDPAYAHVLSITNRINPLLQVFEYYNRQGEALAARARNWVQGISEEGAAAIAAAEQAGM